MVRPRKRLTELLAKAALEGTPTTDAPTKIFRPLFLRSPSSFVGDTNVTGVEFGINTLEGPDLENQQAIATGKTEEISCGMVLRSIGYRSVCADQTIPFDSKRGKVINVNGRVDKGKQRKRCFFVCVIICFYKIKLLLKNVLFRCI